MKGAPPGSLLGISQSKVVMRTMRKTVLMIGLGLAVGARAQDLNVAQGYMDMSSGLMQTSMFNLVMRSAAELDTSPGASHKPVKSLKAVPVDSRRLTYTESPAITSKVKRNYIAFLRSQGLNEGATSMEAYLAKSDFRQDWAKAAAGDGMRRGSALDALAEYWLTNWLIANGKTVNNTRAQAQGLRRQLAPIMAADPTFSKLTNAQRQELAEVWMINAVAQAGGYMAAVRSGDKATIRKASEAAITRFKNEVKIDLRGVKLTDKGFVKA